METRNLYYVLCVAEHKSISKAAEKLFISQPTLSQHINKFEKSLALNSLTGLQHLLVLLMQVNVL